MSAKKVLLRSVHVAGEVVLPGAAGTKRVRELARAKKANLAYLEKQGCYGPVVQAEVVEDEDVEDEDDTTEVDQ